VKQTRLLGAVGGVVAVAVVATVLVIDSRKEPPPRAVAVVESPSPYESPSPSPSPSPEPSPEPEPSESPAPPPGLPACYTHVGKDAPAHRISAVLTAAARKEYWTTTKGITVPVPLMKAIAWQKSRWKSSIVSCDRKTIGVMQVSPKTATWLNERFTVTYEINTLTGNAALGAEYLQWLIKYFGDTKFASRPRRYDLLSNPGMLDMVISAYSAGTTRIDAHGLAGITNPEFVAQVKDLMTTCPCLQL
jgi:hypothetical protein